jgi:Big-like domain-containing protein
MIRRVLPWLMLAVTSGMVACAEWAGSELGGPRLSIVPLISIGAGTVLLDDLDQLHVVVVPISSVGAVTPPPRAVVDTTVPVDAAGDARLSVPVVVIGKAQRFEVTLQGIRSTDRVVLYAGVDTVIVSSAGPTPPVTVPVSYVGPCQIGSGCVVTVAPQDTTLATGGSFVMRISVDSAQIPVTGVPVALTNLTPGLILVGPGPAVTALLSPTGGPARVGAAIRGAADTLRLNVAPLVAPAAVLVNPGYVTLTNLSPGTTAQLTAAVTDIAGKPLPPSLATWTSRAPAVATVSSAGLVTAGAPGSAIVVATAAPGVADSLVVMVGDAITPPGNAIALALIGGRSFGVAKLGQPLAIDVVVDLKAVPTQLLGNYDARFTWNAGVLRFDSTQTGTFASPVIIPDTAAGGILRFNGADVVGTSGSPTLVRLWYTATGPGPSGQVLSLSTLAAAVTRIDLLPGLLVAPGGVTVGP